MAQKQVKIEFDGPLNNQVPPDEFHFTQGSGTPTDWINEEYVKKDTLQIPGPPGPPGPEGPPGACDCDCNGGGGGGDATIETIGKGGVGGESGHWANVVEDPGTAEEAIAIAYDMIVQFLKQNGPKYLTTDVIDEFFTLAEHFQNNADNLRNP